MGWNEVTKFEAIPDIAKTDCLALLCFTGWSSVVDRRDRENAVLNASPGDFTLGPTGARATSASISAHGSTLCWRKRLWTIQWTIKKWQLCWCWTMIDMMNAHDGWCDLVRCPEGLICMIWFSQSLCDFDMQHVLSDSWFGRPCLPHLLQSKQSATASCSRQGVPRFKQSCLLDHPLHSWDSWFQWKHIFWKELKLQTKRASSVYKPTWPIINQYKSI